MNVLIICSANMCRSPMAEGYLKKALSEKGINSVSVRSAALYYQSGSTATSGARATALANGFDLDNHVSTFMDDELFYWADIIFVMTLDHLTHLEIYYPDDADDKVRMLGSFDPEFTGDCQYASPPVRDPYGYDDITYEEVFEQIKECLDHWIDTTFPGRHAR
jgi:protein-tyrosine-phosphatase